MALWQSSGTDSRLDGFGWQVWSGSPGTMTQAHQHDEIEVNLLLGGCLEYLRAGEIWRLEAGQAAVFWGASPHRLLSASPGCQLAWLTLPTPTFARFGLPGSLRLAVWSGDLLVADDLQGSAELLLRWQNDPADAEHAAIAELELQAWLRRFALQTRVLRQIRQTRAGSVGQHHALTLARQLQQDFVQPLKLADLAAQLKLNPNYLSGVFRQVFGMGPQDYLIRCRLAQAQALLISSELSVTQVALESGFASPSRFFAVFAQRHGCSPRAFRQAHRWQEHRQGAGVRP
jgi:AraC family transcriptional regulator, melibiose operon regulatory protein